MTDRDAYYDLIAHLRAARDKINGAVCVLEEASALAAYVSTQMVRETGRLADLASLASLDVSRTIGRLSDIPPDGHPRSAGDSR
jgi:hypothetical protein